MQIEEMLHIAGDLNLKSFNWGQGMVDTLNDLFADSHRITTEVTGNQALAMIRALPPMALVAILNIDVSTSTGRQAGAPEPSKAKDKADGDKSKRPWMSLVLGGAIVVIALVLASVSAVTAVKTGQNPDEGVLKLILSTLVEVLRLFLAPPTTPPATVI